MSHFEQYRYLAQNTTLERFLTFPIEEHRKYCHARLCWSEPTDWKDRSLFDHLTNLVLVYGTNHALKSISYHLK